MRIVVGLALLMTLMLCINTFVSADGWRARQDRAAQLEKVQRENDGRMIRAVFLNQQIQALRKRADVQEHVIRDELGYVRRGDLVLDFSANAAQENAR